MTGSKYYIFITFLFLFFLSVYRGAKVGRYIIASTSAKFNEPDIMNSIKCDMIFPCSHVTQLHENDIVALAANGCSAIVEGVQQSTTNEGIVVAKKKGMLHGPYKATTVGGTLFNGMSISDNPLQGNETIDSRVENSMIAVYDEIKRTAKEFNTRGDLQAGANIASFLRVADAMLNHGSV